MNRIYITLVLFATLAVSWSCNNFLDVSTESSVKPQEAFKDPTLANSSIMSIYEAINNNSFNGRLWPYHGFNNDTEMGLSSSQVFTSVQSDNQTAFGTYKYSGTDNYMGDAFANAMNVVEKANVSIDGLRRYADMKNPQLSYYLGEALFLRAWVYYELVQMFGNIPARFEPLNPNNIYKPRADRDEIYKQLLSDLEEAARLMPWAGELNETQNTLRPNRAAAKALRARIALAAGGYAYHLYGELAVAQLSRDPELSREITYGIARKECQEIMANEGKGFILENDFGKIFKDNCSPIHNIGGEPLWKLPFKFNSRGNNMVSMGVIHRGAGGSTTISGGSDPWTKVYMGGTVGVVATLWYDYDAKDSRRDISVAPFRWWAGQKLVYRVSQMTSGKLRAEWKNSELPIFSANANDGITPIILRYADVILMFAEAENELSNAPTEAAKNALKRVRERAYNGASQSDYIESVSYFKEDFFKAIQNERRLELAGEMIRKADLIRWNCLKSSMDRAKDDIRNLKTLSGNYYDVPSYIFWKFKPGSTTETIWYGLNRGEIAPGTGRQKIEDITTLNNWMANNGWKHWSNAGNLASPPLAPVLFINASPTSGDLSETYINSLYYTNPDRAMDMPLPSTIIMNSQGTLSNSYLGY